MPSKSSTASVKQQSKLSFLSSKPSAAATKGAKGAVLDKSTKPSAKKTSSEDTIDASSSEDERGDNLDDIESLSSDDEKQEAIVASGMPADPPVLTKTPAPVKATRTKAGAKQSPVAASTTTTVSAAVSENVAKPKDAKVDVKSRPHLEVKDRAYSNISNKASEKMGYLAPIHGEDQNRIHKILRVFDLSYEYGPAVGLTRLERWERANALGLKPPQEIYDILNTQEGLTKPAYANNVFAGQV